MSSPRLDRAALDAIHALGAQTGRDLLRTLIDAFCDSSPKLLAAIESALAGRDAEELRRAAHTLKSGSATLGASQLAECARALELRSREGWSDALRLLAAPLRAEADAVFAELRALREQET